MNVQQITTRKVESITPETSLHEAARRMKKLDVGFLPVCDEHRLVGTVTDRDIAKAEGEEPIAAKTLKQVSKAA